MNGHENHDISLEDAAAMTKRYRDQMTDTQKKGGAFGIDGIKKVLNQDGSIGIRYYYGFDDRGIQVLVLVAIDIDGNDMVDGNIAEISVTCPSFCSTDNALNS